jgi:DNA-binding Lrp family transcriptional regulator
MSQRERDWLPWLKQPEARQITQAKAAERMGVSERWVRELLRRRKKEGDRVVVHRLRGRSSNRKLPERLRSRVLRLVEREYRDFGPTLGESQSAVFLTTYVNAVDPLAKVYDGFLIHSRFGRSASLESAPITAASNQPQFVKFRTDLRAPGSRSSRRRISWAATSPDFTAHANPTTRGFAFGKFPEHLTPTATR